MPGLNLFAVVPVKTLAEGKSRLAGALPAADRAALNRRLLDHVLAVAARRPGADRTVVVSADAAVLARAEALSMCALAEPAGDRGLNAALAAGRDEALRRGAGAMLVLPVDLPLLTVADIAALTARAEAGAAQMVIAPDRAGTGTNALLLAPPGAVDLRFGPDSAAAHRAAARAAGLSVAVVRRAGLEFDVDAPDDLARLESLEAAVGGSPGRRIME